MSYHTPATFDEGQRLTSQYVLEQGARQGLSSTAIINNLSELGLTYRRIEMLHDIRRAGAVANAKYPDTAANAAQWFDSVFEPFRADQGLNANQASQLWNKTRTATWDTLEEAEQGLDMMDRYESTFGT